MSKRYPWEDKGWVRGDALSGGNQGRTNLVKRQDEVEFDFVLKELKLQNDPNRRAMFCNEIRSMGVLDHPGIVQVVESNAEEFRSPEITLFMITELVKGIDLEQVGRKSNVRFEDAIQMVIGLLQIVEHCHSRGVVHRDIKPCHVILRDESISSPVLIDFGLAFNEEEQLPEAATEVGQGRGNRFLIGPEQIMGIPTENRSVQLDICQSLGVLYYLMTGQNPGSLRDRDNRMPHQRLPVTFDGEQPKWKSQFLNRIFDKGFQWEPTKRWQSAFELIKQLEELNNSIPSSVNNLRQELNRVVESSGAKTRLQSIRTGALTASTILDLLVSRIESIQFEHVDLVSWGISDRWVRGEHPIPMQPNLLGKANISCRSKLATGGSTISLVVELVGDSELAITISPYTGDFGFFQENRPVKSSDHDVHDSHVWEDFLRTMDKCLLSMLADSLEPKLRQGGTTAAT